MRAAPTADTYVYRKSVGDEPLPGYRLLGPLGHGGFGEVWECEAPGGLRKAVKFVFDERGDFGFGNDHSLRQEYEAVERVKAIRHPFLLTLERVECLDEALIMVMELADRNIQDRFVECQRAGLAGIPRDELLAYMADAAEALDVLSTRHGLQHLDVKPANLFLLGSHVKVGDYGLVRHQAGANHGTCRGLTPKYAAPEVLNGQVESSSDQYSLALVYQEMLTGTFPFDGRTAQHLMIQHAAAEPDVTGLPPRDQVMILRALAKEPSQRFPSCVALVERLMDPTGVVAESETWRDVSGTSMMLRRKRMTQSVVDLVTSGLSGTTPAPETQRPAPTDTRPDAPSETAAPPWSPVTATPQPVAWQMPAVDPIRSTPTVPIGGPFPPGSITTPAPAKSGSLQLVTHREVQQQRPRAPEELIVLSAEQKQPTQREATVPPRPGVVQLPRIYTVVPVTQLRGAPATKSSRPRAADLAETLVLAALTEGERVPQPGEIRGTPEDGLMCRFPVKGGTGMLPLKLAALEEQWSIRGEWQGPGTVAFRRLQSQGLIGKLARKPAGAEVIVILPDPGATIGEVVVVGQLFGPIESSYARHVSQVLPRMMEDVRKHLQNQPERRGSERITADNELEVFPVSGAGEVLPAIPARCRDISTSGIRFEVTAPVPTSYVYVSFTDVPAAAGWGLLTRIMRTQPSGANHILGGRFRLDLR